MIILLISKLLFYFYINIIIYSVKAIFPSTIFKIGKGKRNIGLEEFANQHSVSEYQFLSRLIDLNDVYQKRLDNENKYCRYIDIRTYKDNRVEIKSDNNYINASWINIPNHHSFIATQGPLESTVEDFWTMCYTYDVKVIVMLCKLDEDYKEKCANYWDAKMKNFKIEKKEETIRVDKDIRMRIFKIINNNNGHFKKIIQLHFIGWPDHSAPKEIYAPLIKIINMVDKNKEKSPVVVHCSGGIGRTGTFISIYNLYHEIIKQINNHSLQEIKFSVMNLVRKLKEMRLYLVENENQYNFIYIFANILLSTMN